MIILEIVTAIIYIIVIIAFVLLVLALAIPVGILFGLYWLLFRSWRKRSKTTKLSENNVSNKEVSDSIQSIISKKTTAKKRSSDKIEKKIQKIVERATMKKNRETKGDSDE